MKKSGNPVQTITDEQIRSAIKQLRGTKPTFSTVDVISDALGFYHRDVGVRGASPNRMVG